MDVLYILSGKNGITSFTYKELELLNANGINFTLLFTSFNKANLAPKSHWKYLTIDKFAFLLLFFKIFVNAVISPLFYESIRQKELRFLLLALYFRKKVNADGPFNVHVQMGDHKLIIGYYLMKLSKESILSTTIHAHELYSEIRYHNTKRYRFLLDSCTRIFTISNFNKSILVNDIQLPESKIEVTYLYPSFIKEGFASKKKILMTGNWERKKGYEDVFSVLSELDRTDYIVFIAGKSVNPNVDLNLATMIDKMNLENKVKLLGQVDKTILEILYSFCDIFMLPSKTEYNSTGTPKEREGIPVAVMEAMSFGLPVISSRHAGIPELIYNYLIEEGNKIQLKSLINYCLDNIETIKSEGLRNISIIEEKFSPKNVQSLVDFFNMN